MKNLFPSLFGFGVLLSLLSLPALVLAFIVPSFGLFSAGVIVGAVGLFCCASAVLLKLASLLFRK